MKLAGELIEGVRIAGGSIRANKMRSSLATLGIVIGIVTVTLMGTAIAGLNGAFLRSISSLGTDVMHVSRFSWFIDSYAEWVRFLPVARIHSTARPASSRRSGRSRSN